MDNLDTILFLEMDTEAIQEAESLDMSYLDTIMADDMARVEAERKQVKDDDDDDE